MLLIHCSKSERGIDIAILSVVNFTSLSAFKRSIRMVDFHEFLMCSNE